MGKQGIYKTQEEKQKHLSDALRKNLARRKLPIQNIKPEDENSEFVVIKRKEDKKGK